MILHTLAAAATQFAAAPSISPNNKLPGISQLSEIGGGLMTYALIAATIAFFGGVAVSLASSKMNHHGGAVAGKMTAFSALFVGFAVGSAPAWIAFAQKLGEGVK